MAAARPWHSDSTSRQSGRGGNRQAAGASEGAEATDAGLLKTWSAAPPVWEAAGVFVASCDGSDPWAAYAGGKSGNFVQLVFSFLYLKKSKF